MAGVLCIQFNIENADKEKNLLKIEKYLEQNKDKNLDLVLFPEFFSTNIAYEKATEPEDGGETIKRVCEFAKKLWQTKLRPSAGQKAFRLQSLKKNWASGMAQFTDGKKAPPA